MAKSFAGSTTTDRVEYNSRTIPSAVTIVARIYLDETVPTVQRRIFDAGGVFFMQNTTTGHITLRWAFSTTSGFWQFARPSTGVWTTVVCTYNSAATTNDASMWYDGVSQTIASETTPVGTASHTAGTFVVGNSTALNRAWAGDLAEVAVYDGILGAADIAALSKNFSPLLVKPSSLWFYSPLNRGDSIDYATGINGTVTGATESDHPAVIMPTGALATQYTSAATDAVAPTVTSAAVSATGLVLNINFSESVTIGSGGNGGFAITASGGAVTATYSSGSGSSTLVYTLSRLLDPGLETVTLAYTQPGNGVEDLAGNDLANFSGTSVGGTVVYYPEVVSTSTLASNNSNTTQKTFTYPVDCEKNDLLVLHVRPSSGTDEVNDNSGGFVKLNVTGPESVLFKFCDGTEGRTGNLSFTVRIPNANRATGICWRIQNGGVPYISAVANSLNPADCAPGVGSQYYLGLAIGSTQRTDNLITAAPTSFSGLVQVSSDGTNANTSGTHCRSFGAYYAVEAANLNPSAFTTAGTTSTPKTFTLLIPPTSAVTFESVNMYVGDTIASAVVHPNERGGIVYGVVTQSATPPTPTQILNGQDQNGNAAIAAGSIPVHMTDVVNVPFSGLTASTSYYAHVFQIGSQDSAVSSVAFTTEAGRYYTINKIGALFYDSAQYISSYPDLVNTSDIPDWPWTVTCFSSSDHGAVSSLPAGIFMCGAVGDPTVAANWETYRTARLRGAFTNWATANGVTIPTTDYVYQHPTFLEGEAAKVHKHNGVWYMGIHYGAGGASNDQPEVLLRAAANGPLVWSLINNGNNGRVIDGLTTPENEYPVGPLFAGGDENHRGYQTMALNKFAHINPDTGQPYVYFSKGNHGGGSYGPMGYWGSDDLQTWDQLGQWVVPDFPNIVSRTDDVFDFGAGTPWRVVDDKATSSAIGGEHWLLVGNEEAFSETCVDRWGARPTRNHRIAMIPGSYSDGDPDCGRLHFYSALNYNGTILFVYRGMTCGGTQSETRTRYGTLMLATLTINATAQKPAPIVFPTHDKYVWDTSVSTEVPSWLEFSGATTGFTNVTSDGALFKENAYGARLNVPFDPATTSWAEVYIEEAYGNADTKQVGFGFHGAGDHADANNNYVRGLVKTTDGSSSIQFKSAGTLRIDQDDVWSWNDRAERRNAHGLRWDIDNGMVYWLASNRTKIETDSGYHDTSALTQPNANLYAYVGSKAVAGTFRVKKIEFRIGNASGNTIPTIVSAAATANSVTITFSANCVGDCQGFVVKVNGGVASGTWTRPSLTTALFTPDNAMSGLISYDVTNTDIRNESDLVALADVTGATIENVGPVVDTGASSRQIVGISGTSRAGKSGITAIGTGAGSGFGSAGTTVGS